MIPILTTAPRTRTPWVVLTLIAVTSLVFLFQVGLTPRERFVMYVTWGLVPRRYTDPLWAVQVGLDPTDLLPFLTCVFLHGGWLHMLSNMWTLWLFGGPVEARLGWLRFALLYFVCGMAASWSQLLASPNSPIPTVGASGAVAAVLGAHISLHPASRVLLLIPIIIIPLMIPVPTLAYAAVWFGIQLFQGAGSLMAPDAAGGVAWWAHIGGFLAGLLAVRLLAPPAGDQPD